MDRFARLIEIDNGRQAVLTCELNDDNDHLLVVKSKVRGVVIKISFAYDTPDEALEQMDKCTVEKVNEWMKEFNDWFEEEGINASEA